MSDSPAAALAYLIGVSALNRARIKLRRLREPRYALALILGGAYIWFFLLRPIPGADVRVNRPSTESLLGTTAEMIATLGVALLVISSWISSSSRLALAYTPAEIHFLFPGPLTRRALIAYKISRMQIAVIVNALLWVFILRRGGSTLSPLLRAVSVWSVFTTIYLHRVGAALSRVSWAEHGLAGVRRQRVTLTVLGAVAVAIAWSMLPVIRGTVGAGGPRELFRAIVLALSTPPASWVLAPVRWLLAPSFAGVASEWLAAYPAALAVLAVHLLWVFRADVAFEDAALKASADRVELVEARLQRRGQARVTPRRAGKRRGGARTLPLAPTGIPAFALVWKNALALVRATQIQGLVVVAVAAFPMALVMSTEGGGSLRTFLGLMCLFGAVTLVILGGRAIRNDLRLDLPQIEILKTLPLNGRAIVAAEVASSTISLTLVQLTLLIVAFFALLGNTTLPLGTGERLLVLLFAVPVLFLLNGVTLSIQNGMAVLFPAWTRLGPATGGIEVLGQGVLALLGSVLMTALVLLPVAILVAVMWETMRASGLTGVLFTALGAAVLLVAELAGLMAWLGRAFDRMEPSQVAAP